MTTHGRDTNTHKFIRNLVCVYVTQFGHTYKHLFGHNPVCFDHTHTKPPSGNLICKAVFGPTHILGYNEVCVVRTHTLETRTPL